MPRTLAEPNDGPQRHGSEDKETLVSEAATLRTILELRGGYGKNLLASLVTQGVSPALLQKNIIAAIIIALIARTKREIGAKDKAVIQTRFSPQVSAQDAQNWINAPHVEKRLPRRLETARTSPGPDEIDVSIAGSLLSQPRNEEEISTIVQGRHSMLVAAAAAAMPLRPTARLASLGNGFFSEQAAAFTDADAVNIARGTQIGLAINDQAPIGTNPEMTEAIKEYGSPVIDLALALRKNTHHTILGSLIRHGGRVSTGELTTALAKIKTKT